MEMEAQACYKRNIHKRSLEDIEVIITRFFPTPTHHIHLDATTLLQSASIPDVHMEDADHVAVDAEGNEVRLTDRWFNAVFIYILDFYKLNKTIQLNVDYSNVDQPNQRPFVRPTLHAQLTRLRSFLRPTVMPCFLLLTVNLIVHRRSVKTIFVVCCVSVLF